MTDYVDLGDFNEDTRILAIGSQVMKEKKTVAFVTDDEPDKAERYIRKLRLRFPGIRIIDKFKGPVPKTITVRVGLPLN